MPVMLNRKHLCLGGGIGRRMGLKIPWGFVPVRVRFPPQAPADKNKFRIGLLRYCKYSTFQKKINVTRFASHTAQIYTKDIIFCTFRHMVKIMRWKLDGIWGMIIFYFWHIYGKTSGALQKMFECAHLGFKNLRKDNIIALKGKVHKAMKGEHELGPSLPYHDLEQLMKCSFRVSFCTIKECL